MILKSNDFQEKQRLNVSSNFNQRDIYNGDETLQFSLKHPIFRTLMKLEFEEVLRSFSKREHQ